MAANGRLKAKVDAKFWALGTYNHEQSYSILSNRRLGCVTFTVGPVPFRIEGQFNLDAMFDASANGFADLRVNAAVDTSATLGVEFKNRRWGFISARHFGVTRSTPQPTVTGSVQAAVTLVPKVQLTVNWIGGPTFALLPHASSEASVSGSSCGADFAAGLDVTVGAVLDVQNPMTGGSIGGYGSGGKYHAKRTLGTATIYESPRITRSRSCKVFG